MVHQALGRGILRFMTENAKPRRDADGQLQTLLRRLLPLSTDDALQAFVTKVTDLALELKKAMMEEEALFRVYWVECDAPFQEQRVEVVDDEPTRNILLCTFPGLRRINKNEGQEVEHIVVKASAFLKSAFKKQK
jgi:hypothetical protein